MTLCLWIWVSSCTCLWYAFSSWCCTWCIWNLSADVIQSLFLLVWAPLHHLCLHHLFEGVPVKLSEISQRLFVHNSCPFWYQCYAIQTAFSVLKKKKNLKKVTLHSLVASTLLCGENLDTFSWVVFLLDLALLSPKIIGSTLITNACLKISRDSIAESPVHE